MNKPTSFFDALRKRMQRNPDRKFDQLFWSRFNQEFQRDQKSLWERWITWTAASPWRVALPAGALASILLLFITMHQIRTDEKETHVASDTMQMSSMLEDQEMLHDLDLLASFDSLPTSDE